MSGAFLYVGIVAIWAFVLVPRWLRRPHAATEPAELGPGYEDSADYDEQHDRAGDEEQQPGDAWAAAPTSSEHADGTAAATAPDPARPADTAARRSLAPSSRSRVLQARRRLLTLLLLLCAAAATCTALKITSWWACVPPAGMLGMYLLLLREAALVDAGQARSRMAMELRVQAAIDREQAAWALAAEEQSAQIIDISARVGDQLYDQYADATIRAVGD